MTTGFRDRDAASADQRRLARISIIDMLAESSMNSGALSTSPIRRAMRFHSSSLNEPPRMWFIGTWHSAASRRMAISVRLISSEKIALVMPCLMLADRAKSSPSVDFRTQDEPRRRRADRDASHASSDPGRRSRSARR